MDPAGARTWIETSPPQRVDALDPGVGATDWRPVSIRLAWIVASATAVGTLVAATGCVVAALLLEAGWAWWLMAAAVVVGLIRLVLAVRSVRSWGYAERDADLLVRHGLLVRRLSIVPYARMQFVDVTAGPLERLLGLATVTLHTAAAGSDARVPGLPGAEAARLRDRLAALGEARAEGL